MASQRDAAKSSASNPEDDDPELTGQLAISSQVRVDILREENRHKEKLAAGERGWIGGLLGGRDHAPAFIAFIAMIVALIGVGWGLSNTAAATAEDRAFWWDVTQTILTFAGTALGFAVGKAGR